MLLLLASWGEEVAAVPADVGILEDVAEMMEDAMMEDAEMEDAGMMEDTGMTEDAGMMEDVAVHAAEAGLL